MRSLLASRCLRTSSRAHGLGQRKRSQTLLRAGIVERVAVRHNSSCLSTACTLVELKQITAQPPPTAMLHAGESVSTTALVDGHLRDTEERGRLPYREPLALGVGRTGRSTALRLASCPEFRLLTLVGLLLCTMLG